MKWSAIFFLLPLPLYASDSLPQRATTITHLEAVRYGEDGLQQDTASVKEWSQNAHHTTTLTQPELKRYHQNQLVWHITANEGVGHQRGMDPTAWDDLTLTGRVTIVYFAADRNQVWQLNTESLHLTPTEANTETVAILKGPGQNTLQSVGAHVDFTTGNVQLLSEVQSHYDPNPF